ncbi:helix-turn-helix transcriptional regulator [Phenylobacterium sp.]|uniref:helix-turn-helix domain-containing protein n=1 Tax=Phenylobacterium sp. TaxID=1871053 RepID=UPI002735E728|nr:helix-turn-helix transcriptional regulator [Phenylobacterium sp.]MDP3592302.1 helix-turn-helix transcriptional regulator [Phenylobacterium sp.]
MALFFDRQWFEARLAERALSQRVMAAAAGMSEAELVLVFKDQRELSAEEVGIFADLLGVPPTQIAHHAGVSTPVPGQDDLPGRLLALERKVAVLEAEIARLKGR